MTLAKTSLRLNGSAMKPPAQGMFSLKSEASGVHLGSTSFAGSAAS
jgi:hypothetical protein